MSTRTAAPPTRIGIVGTGSHLPATVVGNDEVGARAGVEEEWIVRKTGVRTRRYAAAHEATSDLAAAAAQAALDDAGILPGQLEQIIVATSTPDHPQPATAAIVQHRLGADGVPAYDVNAVCSGFLFALDAAAARLRDGYALVVGADVYSRIIDPADRRTAVLFGDGAGAVVLGPVAEDHGLVATSLRTHGMHHRMIEVPNGGSRTPSRDVPPDDPGQYFTMDGRAVREFVTEQLPLAVKEILRKADATEEEVRHFIPHQANGRMLRDIEPSLGLTRARHHLVVDEFGNTGAASVPIALDYANRAGHLRPGDGVLLAAFGGGMSIGSALIKWGGALTP
ncbi:3-oxoacyl-ACP synthase III family protein [Glycomyces terrestris]|uniref:Ketoacyl-ACP synthase III n=1 Tax=Glycomyces terrestris TaxID=2493553 RepID=A0A426UY66_9ACTN|nr:ketoacyl-ACP synthase III [Glycomyces terrestris]RRR99517.1 ketoacyl-ACP synthase III [Glycomyces terrestris]